MMLPLHVNTKLSDSLVQKHTEQPSLASAQEMARRVQASSSATRSSAKPADEIDTTARGLSMPRAPRRPPCAARASTAAAAQTTATTSNSRPHQIPTQKRKRSDDFGLLSRCSRGPLWRSMRSHTASPPGRCPRRYPRPSRHPTATDRPESHQRRSLKLKTRGQTTTR